MKKLALLVMAAFSASLIFACSAEPEVGEGVKEVIVEKEVEKIVEVPVEKIVEKIVTESVPQPVGYMMEAPENVTNTGGTVKTAFGVTMGHFDAHQGAGTHVLGHAYDGLHVKNIADGLRTFAPLLATEWDIAADGKSYTFTIRDGVKFHDGSDLTVEDVVTSFSRMALPQDGFVSPNASFYDVVTSIEKVGDNQVKFSLSAVSYTHLTLPTNREV